MQLIILVAVALVVGVFSLVLFSILARRERIARWQPPRAHASTSGVRPLQIFWRIASGVLIFAAILAGISFLARQSR